VFSFVSYNRPLDLSRTAKGTDILHLCMESEGVARKIVLQK